MDIEKLQLEPGDWMVANCGKMPSEKNCKLVMMAPIEQKEDLMAAGIEHMVTSHSHERDEAQRMVEEQGEEIFEIMTVAKASVV